MANIAIIGASEHSERTGKLWQYLEAHGHQIILAADSAEQTRASMTRIESSGTKIDAAFIANMPGSDTTQAIERRLANEFRMMPGGPRIISLVDKEDRTSGGFTWYDRFAGICSSETALRAMEKELVIESKDSKERMVLA